MKTDYTNKHRSPNQNRRRMLTRMARIKAQGTAGSGAVIHVIDDRMNDLGLAGAGGAFYGSAYITSPLLVVRCLIGPINSTSTKDSRLSLVQLVRKWRLEGVR